MAWREQYRAGGPIGIRDRLDDSIERGDVLLDTWTSKKEKTKLHSKRLFPQHVRLQGSTSLWLTKTPKPISNGPVSSHLQAHKKLNGFVVVAAERDALDALLCVRMKS